MISGQGKTSKGGGPSPGPGPGPPLLTSTSPAYLISLLLMAEA